MKTVFSVLAAGGVLGLSAIGMTIVTRPGKSPHKGGRTPVLVELFTSEGCSSCPSADALLARLQAAQPEEGALIIPLSEHVDYWDGANWRDRFSSPKFSERQAQYVQALHANGAYTPQMVVDGQSEFVGSDEGTAADSISEAASRKKARVELNASELGGELSVKVSVDELTYAHPESVNDVFIAVTENNLQTQVGGGENDGRLLKHTAVVRVLQRVGELSGTTPFKGTATLKVNPRWKKGDLSIVAFVQGRRTRRVVGAGISTLP